MRMVLALDPDDAPEALLGQASPWLTRFGGKCDLRACLRVVLPGDPLTGSAPIFGYTEVLDGLERDWQARLDALSRNLPDEVRGDPRVVMGSPMDVLCQEEWDLWILGTHQRDGMERLLIGSVAERLLRKVKGPCLVLPIGCPSLEAGPIKVVVPMEVEKPELAALKWVREHLPKAEILALYVRIRLPWLEARLLDSVPGRELDDAAEGRLREVLDGAGFSDIRVASRTQDGGHVGDTIQAYADEVEADLIAVPTHGRGALARLFMGSVTERVVRGASRAVLVVRPSEER